ncbi:MAG TPA: ABC transporter permease, partial [Coriobacteriia bacterium]|nr:ABC transporter permease [Coriobacteriia bacterium]
RGHTSLLERVFPPLRRAPVHWRMVLRGIGRSKRRSLSVVLGIVLAMTLVFSAWGMVDTVRILLDRHFNTIMRYDADVLTTVPVDGTVLSRIGSVPGVRRAEPVITLETSVRGPDGTYSTTLFAFDADTEVHGFVSSQSRRPGTGALVGSAILDKTGAAVGQTVALSLPGLGATFDVTVQDVVAEPMGSPVYVTRALLEDRLRSAGVSDWSSKLEQPGVSTVQVIFDEGVDRKAVLADLRALEGVALASDAQATYALIQDYMGLFYLFVGIMLVFGGILALALIFNIVSVNLAERTGELATMRANGLSSRRIGGLVLAENMILTALGLIPGIAVAYAAASWLMSTYTSDMLSFDLEFHPSSLILSALSMFLITAVSLWPGMRAVRRLDIATEVRKRSQ